MESFIEQVAADHMTRNVKTVRRDLTLRELGDLFESEDFNTYPARLGRPQQERQPVDRGQQPLGRFCHMVFFMADIRSAAPLR